MCKRISFLLLAIFIIQSCASQKCVLRRNERSGFIVAKNFGFKEIILRNDISDIELELGEVVNAYCDTGFRSCVDLGREIELYCLNDNKLYYKKSGMKEPLPIYCTLTCPWSEEVQLYESKKKLPNCEPHTSLTLGFRASQTLSGIYAGICYDWSSLHLKYIIYKTHKSSRRQNMILPDSKTSIQTIGGKLKSVTMDKRIPNFETYFKFMTQNSFKEKYEVLQRNYSLLELFTFEYDSLVQDQPMEELSKPYAKLLNIIWWQNLRLGNWRTFLKLLEERSAAVEYSVVTGTDGAVVVPDVRGACEANVILEVAAEDAGSGKIAAPEYIWTHLKAVPDNETDDFVVIAYNSPFYTKEDSIIFCHDMCDEIPWFHRFLSIRLMPARGLMFCCRPNEVAHKLKNFPHFTDEAANYTDVLTTSCPVNLPNTCPRF